MSNSPAKSVPAAPERRVAQSLWILQERRVAPAAPDAGAPLPSTTEILELAARLQDVTAGRGLYHAVERLRDMALEYRAAYERVKVLLELEHDLRKNDQRRAEAAELERDDLKRQIASGTDDWIDIAGEPFFVPSKVADEISKMDTKLAALREEKERDERKLKRSQEIIAALSRDGGGTISKDLTI